MSGFDGKLSICPVSYSTNYFFALYHVYSFIFIISLYIIIIFLNTRGIGVVRTRFVMTQNDIRFARKKTQTISFVERGIERLGFGH